MTIIQVWLFVLEQNLSYSCLIMVGSLDLSQIGKKIQTKCKQGPKASSSVAWLSSPDYTKLVFLTFGAFVGIFFPESNRSLPFSFHSQSVAAQHAFCRCNSANVNLIPESCSRESYIWQGKIPA